MNPSQDTCLRVVSVPRGKGLLGMHRFGWHRLRHCALKKLLARAAWLRPLLFLLLWPLLVLLISEVDAQDEPSAELPETVVLGRPGNFPAEPLGEGEILSANRTPTSISDTGSSYTVITREAIDSRQQPFVSDVLRGTVGLDVTRQGGLDVVRQGGAGSNTSVFLRGANSQHTKVLIDGIPVNDPSNPTRGFDFSTLSVDNIDRIEILRGPQSVLYGSDPLGGVVNIITVRGKIGRAHV